jgi:hypothetical protein
MYLGDIQIRTLNNGGRPLNREQEHLELQEPLFLGVVAREIQKMQLEE